MPFYGSYLLAEFCQDINIYKNRQDFYIEADFD